MSTAENDLKNFSAFVHERIASGEATELGLPKLFDLWMLQNPSDAEHVTNVATINASINDFMKGERGTPSGEHSRALRTEYGLHDE